jgi:hypothetical protein
MKKFVRPVFDGRCLEFRYTDGEVSIYGNREGMEKLSKFCLQLGKSGVETEHIHLEDQMVLTPRSLRGTIGLFLTPPEAGKTQNP